MKNSVIVLATIMFYFLISGCNSQNSKSKLKTKIDTVSYIIGTNIGNNFKQNALEINSEALVKGMEESMKGEKPMFSDSVVKKIMMAFQKEQQGKMDLKKKGDFDKNKKEGDAFLAANKSKTGIKVLPSGVQYKILTEGKGPKPTAEDQVKVNYHGTLIDGTVFDSSYERKEPATFPVNAVIKGWTEILQLMPVGSVWEVYIPAELAYGDRETGKIKSGSTLIFKVELISIEKPAEKPQTEKSKK